MSFFFPEKKIKIINASNNNNISTVDIIRVLGMHDKKIPIPTILFPNFIFFIFDNH